MRVARYLQGSAVVVQNAENKGYFYIVKSGLLQVDSEHRLNDKVLSVFGPGDSFGLVSALTGHRFLVTVFAVKDSEVIELPVSDFGAYLKKQPSLATGMLRLYSNELKAIHKHLAMVNPVETRYNSPARLPAQAEEFMALEKPECARKALRFFLEWSMNNSELSDMRHSVQERLNEIVDVVEPDLSGHNIKLTTGQVVFVENEISREIFVIKSGHIRLFTLARGQELLIDVLGPGEIFGEMSFIDNGMRIATAVSEGDTEIMKFSPETLFDGMGEIILQKIFISLARRIWFSHQRLVILRLKDPVARLYAFVYNLIRNDEIIHSSVNQKQSFTFNIGLPELKKMCGLSRISDTKLEVFIKDNNLELNSGSLVVKNRKQVEDRISVFKTKVGQISAELV